MTTNSTRPRIRFAAGAAVLLLIAGATGCGLDKQSAPPLAGPSEFANALSLVADPDLLPRDGESQSRITLTFIGGDAAPLANRPVTLALTPNDAGTLSATQVNTDSAGRAVVFYTAPPSDSLFTSAAITATPFGNNFEAAVTRSITVALTGPAAATAAFTVSPTSPQRFQLTTFDASGTTFNGTGCNGSCTYAWTIGSETTASGQIVTHRFQNEGSHAITLEVTAPTGVRTRRQQVITVGAAAGPTATFTISPSNPRTGDVVQFSGASSTAANGASIVEYTWDFGGPAASPATGSGVTATTTFTQARTFVVRLTIRDSNGLTATTTQNVTVAVP